MSVPLYGVAQVPGVMLKAAMRVLRVARKLSASVMTAFALAALQLMPIVKAESRAVASASSCS